MLTSLVDEKVVRQKIDAEFFNLCVHDSNGDLKPYVCLICDKFLHPQELKYIDKKELLSCSNILCPNTLNKVSPHSGIASSYTYDGLIAEEVTGEDIALIKEMLLSPRGHYSTGTQNRSNGFVVCASCKYGVDRQQMPKYAIANNYCFGAAPPCLTCLNEAELAMLSPVKTWGYCFLYTGGEKKQLRGSLSYYKVKMESIARTIAQFDIAGLNKDIVVVLHGKMTQSQRSRALSKNKVRTMELLVAIEWLLLNNEEWRTQNISLNEIRQQLRQPVIVDQSTEINDSEEEQASNIESTDTFAVYFPDGNTTSLTGGQENIEEFRRIVSEVKRSGFNIQVRNDLSREAVYDYKDSNLVNACILQYPYGRGGLHEKRLKGDGSISDSIDVGEYVEHVSMLSQLPFQEELFSLILYNMYVKQEMVKSACFKVRKTATADRIATELTSEDIDLAINRRENRQGSGGSSEARTFIDTIDLITKHIPHSSGAAKTSLNDSGSTPALLWHTKFLPNCHTGR